jgi:hypothetical protein
MKAAHLTYHYGNDKPWRGEMYADYTKYNWDMMVQSLELLCVDPHVRRKLNAFCVAYGEPVIPQLPPG